MDCFPGAAMFKKILFPFLALTLFACSVRPTPAPGQLEDEQRAVYAALLHNLYSSSNFVIMDTTATSPGGGGHYFHTQ